MYKNQNLFQNIHIQILITLKYNAIHVKGYYSTYVYIVITI